MAHATNQAKVPRAGRGGTIPPVHAQFGQPGGNKRGAGVNKEKLAARRDLQAQLRDVIHMTHEELRAVYDNPSKPRMIQIFAIALHRGKLDEAMIIWHEVFGMPKGKMENTNVEIKLTAKERREEFLREFGRNNREEE